MNKLITIFIFLFGNSLYAKSNDIVFEYKTRINYFERYVVSFKYKNEVEINGIQLTNKEIKSLRPELDLVKKIEKNSEAKNCLNGEYRLHSLEKKKILETEKGCMESDRYKELSNAFLKIIN